jgi:hypothetical protein
MSYPEDVLSTVTSVNGSRGSTQGNTHKNSTATIRAKVTSNNNTRSHAGPGV